MLPFLNLQRVFKPGHLVMVGLEGTKLDPQQAQFLRSQGLRAVCLFRSNLGSAEEVRQLTTALRGVMGPGALIAVDQEGGATSRAQFLPQAPSAMCLGAAGNPILADQVGAAVSRGLRSLGFNWNFAPVLDVNNNPLNPVIGERSFSQDPAAVARMAGAWMRGALHERVACCVKHFPGHGDTHVDSHLALPTVDKSLSELLMLELLPFHKLRLDAPAMMTAHIVYPQLDPAHPATLSRVILRDLLRDTWKYKGVIITDSLVMKAIHDRYGHHAAAPMALRAGADMVMALGTPAEQAQAVQALQDGLDDGSLSAREMFRSRRRLDDLALRYPAEIGVYSDEMRESDEQLMHRAWADGLCTVGLAEPPRPGTRLRVITQRSVASDQVSEAGVPAQRVVRVFDGFDDVVLEQVDDLAQLDWQALPQDDRFTVLVSNSRVRYGTQAAHWRPDLHIVLWNPFQVLDVCAPALVSWGYANGALDAVQAWLAGTPANGRSPVTLLIPAPGGPAASV
ncbi:MAG: nagZ [Rhodoferax sp.]|nr:nagZ [Rhodoferax sp.]